VVPIANPGLCHLRQQGLRVAEQNVLELPGPHEFPFELLTSQTIGMSRALDDAAARVVSPHMNSAPPTMPSLPTTAISADEPSSTTNSNETIEVVGK